MAPTKNTALPKKVVKKTVCKAKAAKPPLKTPTCIKVKIANLVALEQLTKLSNLPKALSSPISIFPQPIKIETGTEKVTRNTPKVTKKTPDVTKKTQTGTEKVTRNTPKVTKKTPDVTKKTLEVTKKTPDVTKKTPDVTEKTPEVTKTTPKVTQTKPAPKQKRKIPAKLSDDSSSDTPLAKKTSKASESSSKPKRLTKPLLKATENESISSFKGPAKKKLDTSDSDDFESSQIVMKKPGPKSRTILSLVKKKSDSEGSPQDVKKKIGKSSRGKEQENIQHKVILELPVGAGIKTAGEETSKAPVKRVLTRNQTHKKTETVTEGTKTAIGETPAKKPKERPKRSVIKEINRPTLKITRATKGKSMTAKDIKTAASMLESALSDAAPAVTRSNSVNSVKSNLSWIRDVSTESITSDTTTCFTVSSSEFVRFDKKLPLVKIDDTLNRQTATEVVDKTMLENESTSSDSSTDSSDSSSDTDSDMNVSMSKPELNLSTSSVTGKSSSSEGNTDNIELLSLEIDKLTDLMKNFNTEMSKWIECDKDDTETFSTVLEAMNLEKDVITNCEKFTGIIEAVGCNMKKSKPENCSPEACRSREMTTQEDGGHRDYYSSPDRAEDRTASRDPDEPYEPIDRPSPTTLEKFPTNVPITSALTPCKSNCSSETFTSDNCNYESFENRVCEDEDALSLYAESITGVESSRHSTVSIQEPYVPKPPLIQNFPRLQEAYVPKPTRSWQYEKYTYQPTRIEEIHRRDDIPLKAIKPNMVEKQSADSSSISKHVNLTNTALCLLDANRQSSPVEDPVKTIEQPVSSRRIFEDYNKYSKPLNPVKSVLYRGHCFFYLAIQCKKIFNCRFPHVPIEMNVLRLRLSAISDVSLVEEYLLTVRYNNLRRKYGLLFMQECKRRELTRLLLEMAIDLGLGVLEWEDRTLIANALEITLFHLNSVSFDTCEDLLKFTHVNTMLCDALLARMAESQNFAQFKQAFVKLANFMSQIKRPVDIKVASNILERVCILQCDDSLAWGMLCLMKNTDRRIFSDGHTNSFEVQLSNIGNEVHVAYLMAKKEAIEMQLRSESAGATDQSPAQDGPRHPSPDTTNTTSLKKAQIAQTTTFNRTIDTEAIRHLFKSPLKPAPKPRFSVPMVQYWRRGQGVREIRGRPHFFNNPTNH